MSCVIDCNRHGNAVGGANDWLRKLSPRGIRQAKAFGQARKAAGETYSLVITSGVLRTEQTADKICIAMDLEPRIRLAFPSMFDPVELDDLARQRQEAYEKLGSQPLIQYQAECPEAMGALGLLAAQDLQTALGLNMGMRPTMNSLIVGHGVYTNQIILTAFREYLSQGMKDWLLYDAPLAECAGYRLVFDDDGKLRDMLRLPQIILDV